MIGDAERDAVRQLANQARNTIVERFLKAQVRPKGHQHLVAWGQYLDLQQIRLSDQFGIYGTSAGVQVLALHDELHNDLWRKALRILPMERSVNSGDPADAPADLVRRYFVEKNDLKVVHKVAALVDVVSPGVDVVPGRSYYVVERLLALRLRGGGWPDLRTRTLESYTTSKVHATACALFALARLPDVRSGPEWHEAVTWLARNLTADLQSIATLSICVLALSAGPASPDPVSENLRATCLQAVREWSERAAPKDVLRALEATEYLVPGRDSRAPLADHEFTFLLYSPHCLAALALLRSDLSREDVLSDYVIEVVRVVAQTVCQRQAFVAAGRTLVSSVEHLWIYRLLHAFESWCS
jgi:hypothetical protein